MTLPPNDCQYVRAGDRISCPRCGHDRVWTRQDLVPRRNCPAAYPWLYRAATRYLLGDLVAMLAAALWITPAVKWLEVKTGVECGCGTRQAKLNAWHARQAARLSVQIERLKQFTSKWTTRKAKHELQRSDV